MEITNIYSQKAKAELFSIEMTTEVKFPSWQWHEPNSTSKLLKIDEKLRYDFDIIHHSASPTAGDKLNRNERFYVSRKIFAWRRRAAKSCINYANHGISGWQWVDYETNENKYSRRHAAGRSNQLLPERSAFGRKSRLPRDFRWRQTIFHFLALTVNESSKHFSRLSAQSIMHVWKSAGARHHH